MTEWILQGNALEVLSVVPDGVADTCVTSPPYYGLRDYGTGTWVGGDPSCPHRRLSKYSTKCTTGHQQQELAGNVGDAIYKTVCPLCGAVREDKQIGLEETPEEYVKKLVEVFREVRRVLKDDGTLWVNIGDSYDIGKSGVKPKDLIGIPWLLAFALREDGWYLRQDIVWHKSNPMPESVKDRCTKSHEYIFLLSKSPQYYFDYTQMQEETTDGSRNKRDVWEVPVQPIKDAHFATFPERLIEPCILAGSREGGVVLDPFFGSGTTGRVALKHNRGYIGVELNPEYIEIAKKRLNGVQTSLF